MALKKLAIGAAALSAARVTQTALTFLSLPILARLLAPAEFGLAALAMSFAFFTMAIADAGMGQSLVRTPASETSIWSSAFWMILALSTTLACFLLAIAWPAAWFFDQPGLGPLILALAPIPIIQGLAAPAAADLQQRECFLHLATAEIMGALAGVGCAVLLALAGYGPWAIVGQQLAMWTVKAIVVAVTTRFRPRFIIKREGLAPHLRFGLNTAGWSLANFFARQIDPLVIARVIGTASLGYYSVANRLITLPGHLVSGPVQSTLYTRMVALRDNLPALKSLVLIATRALAGFVFLPMAILCAAAPAFIQVFLSEKWMPAAPLLAVMIPVGALQAVTGLNGVILMAIGRTGVRLRLTVEFTLLWICVVLLVAPFGLMAVATAFSATFLLYLPRTCHLFLSPIGCTVTEYALKLKTPLAIACGAALIHVMLKTLLSLSGIAEVGLAIVEVMLGYAVVAFTLRGALRSDLQTVRGLFAGLSPPLAHGK